METYKREIQLKNGRELIVRTPVEKDAQNLIDQMKLVDNETRFLARESGEFGFTLEQEIEFIKNTNKNDNIQFLVAEVDGDIIGNCSVGTVMSYKRFLHRAAMGIAIRKDYWGMGIGKALMQGCIDWCLEKGVEQLELDVVTQNKRAISMYESLGFKNYGTKKHAMKYGDGTYADEYFMIKFLD